MAEPTPFLYGKHRTRFNRLALAHGVKLDWENVLNSRHEPGDPYVLTGTCEVPQVQGPAVTVPVVVKIVPVRKHQGVQREVDMRAMLHKRRGITWAAVPIVSVLCTPTATTLCMRRASCDLDTALSAEKDIGAAPHAREWLLQVACAMDEMHAVGAAHRDIKPQNILVRPVPVAVRGGTLQDELAMLMEDVFEMDIQEDAPTNVQRWVATPPHVASLCNVRYVACLCDFDFVTRLHKDGKPLALSCMGTHLYAPPQSWWKNVARRHPNRFFDTWAPCTPPGEQDSVLRAVMDAPYDAAAADVWSYGVTLFEAAYDSMPFPMASPAEVEFAQFMAAFYPDCMAAPAMCPVAGGDTQWAPVHHLPPWTWPDGGGECLAMRHLIVQCLHPDPALRPTAAAIRGHPWFDTPEWVPPNPAMYALMAPQSPSHTRPASPLDSPRPRTAWSYDSPQAAAASPARPVAAASGGGCARDGSY